MICQECGKECRRVFVSRYHDGRKTCQGCYYKKYKKERTGGSKQRITILSKNKYKFVFVLKRGVLSPEEIISKIRSVFEFEIHEEIKANQ